MMYPTSVFSAVHLEVGHVVRKPCDEDGALFAAATVRHRLRLDDRPEMLRFLRVSM